MVRAGKKCDARVVGVGCWGAGGEAGSFYLFCCMDGGWSYAAALFPPSLFLFGERGVLGVRLFSCFFAWITLLKVGRVREGVVRLASFLLAFDHLRCFFKKKETLVIQE